MPIEIHATLGPASFDGAVIRSLLLAGASVIRLNMSHCTRDSLPGLVDRIRRHSLETGHPVRIGPDIRGRKLRIGPLADGHATLVAGRDYDLVCVDEGEELVGDDRADLGRPSTAGP